MHAAHEELAVLDRTEGVLEIDVARADGLDFRPAKLDPGLKALEHGNIFNRDPVRPRRLLMHKREILRLNALVVQDGVALVTLRMYFKDSRVKLELGLCKGKKLHDKRDSEAERQSKRDIERAMKNAE